MERAASDAKRRRRMRLPWLLLAGSLGVSVLGGWLAARSISSLLARVEQLEREATESEARVAELQVLRDSMARRLRLLEQQGPGVLDDGPQARERNRRLEPQPMPAPPPPTPPPPASVEPRLAKKRPGPTPR